MMNIIHEASGNWEKLKSSLKDQTEKLVMP